MFCAMLAAGNTTSFFFFFKSEKEKIGYLFTEL